MMHDEWVLKHAESEFKDLPQAVYLMGPSMGKKRSSHNPAKTKIEIEHRIH
jgi:hypothetical protein